MSSSISLPTFYERERLRYQKLNAAMSAISAKFAAGVGSADLDWTPLTAEGNLDMDIYYILGGRQIWGFVNAGEYDDLDAAISAAGSGGVVLVPPETTLVTNGSGVSGTGVTVIGSGPSSVIQMTEDATSGYMMRITGGSRCLLSNLTLDGNSATGSSQLGIEVVGSDHLTVHNCFFRNFSGAALMIRNESESVIVTGCHFEGGDEEHIYVTRCAHLVVDGCTFDNSGDRTIRLECADSSSAIEAVVTDCVIDNPGGVAIKAHGAGIVGTTSPARVWLSNVRVLTGGGVSEHSIEIGSPSLTMEEISIDGCTVREATDSAISVIANHGVIANCSVDNPTGTGIDLNSSRYMVVSDNYVYNASVGVDISDTDSSDCTVHGNVFRACTTAIEYGGLDHRVYGNSGANQQQPPGVYDAITTPSATYTWSLPTPIGDAPGTVASLDIPAGVLQQSSVVKVYVTGRATTVDDDMTVNLKINDGEIAFVSFPEGVTESFVLQGYCQVTSYASDEAKGFGHGLGTGSHVTSSGTKAVPNRITWTATNITADCSAAIPISVEVRGVGVDMDNLSAEVSNMVIEYGHGQNRTFS